MRYPTRAPASGAVRVDGALRAFVIAGDLRLSAISMPVSLPVGQASGPGPQASEPQPPEPMSFEFILAADSLLVQVSKLGQPVSKVSQ